jgi:hypothetical protein
VIESSNIQFQLAFLNRIRLCIEHCFSVASLNHSRKTQAPPL